MASPDLTGELLGPFRLERVLGRGAMGAVYAGVHEGRGIRAAIKVIAPQNGAVDDTMVARFEREIELLKRFKHEHIVKFYGAQIDRGIRYYAMELVDGETLEHLLDRLGALQPLRACHYVAQVCDALQEMHAEGVVHRDLKPANVMVDRNHKAKLTDFGIAKDTSQVFGDKLTKADTTVGTVAYMAPEQLAGKPVSRRSDLYSLGIILYELLTGRLPFNGRTVFEYINERTTGLYPPPSRVNPEVPVEFDQLVGQLMQNDPEDRPKDAYVVLQRLQELMKKGKDGTLTLSQPDGAGGMLDATEAIGVRNPPAEAKKRSGKSLRGTIFRSLVFGSPRRTSKEAPPIWEQAWFHVAVLLGVAGALAWGFWPLGEDALFEKGEALMASESDADWDTARDKFFAPLLAKYPATRHAGKVQEHYERIAAQDCHHQLERARKFGIPANASDACRKAFQAVSFRDSLDNRDLAERQLKAIAVTYEGSEKDRPWALWARRELASAARNDGENARRVDKREALQQSIAKMEEARAAGKLAEYFQFCEGALALYAQDEEVADLLKPLRERYEAIKDGKK